MVQKNETRHLSNCQIAAERSVISADVTTSHVPVQKRKEDAEQILYLDRV